MGIDDIVTKEENKKTISIAEKVWEVANPLKAFESTLIKTNAENKIEVGCGTYLWLGMGVYGGFMGYANHLELVPLGYLLNEGTNAYADTVGLRTVLGCRDGLTTGVLLVGMILMGKMLYGAGKGIHVGYTCLQENKAKE